VATRRAARPPLDGLTSHAGSDRDARKVRSPAPVFGNVPRSVEPLKAAYPTAACRFAAYALAISTLFAPSSRMRRQQEKKASASWSRAKTFTAIGPSGMEGVASRS